MIDQERQALFQGELHHYYIVLRMRAKQLIIKVKDLENLNRYCRVIDQQFICSQYMTFKANFESPEDVFVHLAENFSEIVIEKDVIRFSYIIGKKKLVREVIIELRNEIQQNSALDIAQLKTQFIIQLQQRDDRIATLEQGFMEVVQQLKQLKKKIEEKEQEKQQKMEEIHDRLQREEKRNKDVEERLQKTETILEVLQLEGKSSTPKKQKDFVERQRTIISPQPISHHPYNPHKEYYTLINSAGHSAIMARVGGKSGSYYNFVNKLEIPAKQRIKYTINIIKTTCSCLMVGFCTEAGLGTIDNHSNHESAYYCCLGSGQLWEGGDGITLSNCGSVDGQVVECTADLTEGRLQWSRGGRILSECSVPTAMKEKAIYFSILLYHSGDSLEISSA